MLNIFQHPWLLLIVSFVLLVIVYIMRQRCSDKQKAWHILIPFLMAAVALSIDHFVKTDIEKITGVIDSVITATMEKNADAFEPLISDNYSDRYIRSKQALLKSCRGMINRQNFKSIKMTYHNIVIENEEANTEFILRLRAYPSDTSMPTPEFTFVKLYLVFNKQPDKSWAIRSTKQVELNNSSVSWRR